MKIKCQECGHENELERIYCHGCGVKIDRSQLPPEKPDTSKKKRKKIGQNSLGWLIFVQNAKRLVLTLALSVLVAIVLCIFKPSDRVPVFTEDQRMSAPLDLPTEWEALAMSPTPVSRVYEQWQINVYLKDKIKPRKSDKGDVKLIGTYVNFEPSLIIVTGEFDFFGVITLDYTQKWQLDGTNIPANQKLVEAQLGSLTIPMALVKPIFGPLVDMSWKKFETEQNLLLQLKNKVVKEKLVLFNKSAQAQ